MPDLRLVSIEAVDSNDQLIGALLEFRGASVLKGGANDLKVYVKKENVPFFRIYEFYSLSEIETLTEKGAEMLPSPGPIGVLSVSIQLLAGTDRETRDLAQRLALHWKRRLGGADVSLADTAAGAEWDPCNPGVGIKGGPVRPGDAEVKGL